jgi:HAD superfamily hydrolase (TIGR01509 family)
VVFDFDGVVFDTMRYHAEAYRRLFREAADVEVEDREVFLREGQPSQDVIADLARLKGLEWSEERVLELAERKHEIFSKVQEAEPYPGVLELLDDLFERDVLVGLVTGTDPRNVEALLGDRVEGFDAVVTGDDVDEGKPEAEPYIRAIETLGVDPDEVLVVENAPLGIFSAERAGARVVAVATTLPEDDLGAADDVLGDVGDVLDLLEGDA